MRAETGFPRPTSGKAAANDGRELQAPSSKHRTERPERASPPAQQIASISSSASNRLPVCDRAGQDRADTSDTDSCRRPRHLLLSYPSLLEAIHPPSWPASNELHYGGSSRICCVAQSCHELMCVLPGHSSALSESNGHGHGMLRSLRGKSQ